MAYATTAVPVERSKESIRQLLIKAGAKGVQFAEQFDTGDINVRFVKEVDGTMRTVSVNLHVPEPEPPKHKRQVRYSQGKISYSKTYEQRKEQMYRATYRAMHYWLKSQFEAVEFGLFSWEDAFLSHFEWVIDGRRGTVGELIKPQLSNGSNLLMSPKNFVDGEFSE